MVVDLGEAACFFWIIRTSSIPDSVLEADYMLLNRKLFCTLHLINRGSCLAPLFEYVHCLILFPLDTPFVSTPKSDSALFIYMVLKSIYFSHQRATD